MAIGIRTGFLFVLFSWAAFELLGAAYVHNIRVIYQLAAGQVVVFYHDVRLYRYVDAALLALGFLFHRVTLLVVTKTVMFLGVLFLPASVRRWVDDVLVYPERLTRRLHLRLHIRYTSRFETEMVSWVWALTYSLVLFIVVGSTIQIAALVLEGALALPTIVLQHKIQLLTSSLSFMIGTAVRMCIRFLWEQLEPCVPKTVRDLIEHSKVYVFRKAVHVRGRVADRIAPEEEEGPYNHP